MKEKTKVLSVALAEQDGDGVTLGLDDRQSALDRVVRDCERWELEAPERTRGPSL